MSPATKGTSAAAGIAGSLVVIVVWVLHQYAGVDVPPEVAGAAGMILTAVAGLFVHGGINGAAPG
jgi:hypothetical protein